MELLVLLLVLVAVNAALWLGWGVDSRDNENWDPAGRSWTRGRSTDRPEPSRPDDSTREANVLAC
ncbi:MAG TPA: hypothetical protein VEL73_10405 [Mycobacteriales bacterium]|nr:hypothetical protein [Mycobacteriales bacterium]